MDDLWQIGDAVLLIRKRLPLLSAAFLRRSDDG